MIVFHGENIMCAINSAIQFHAKIQCRNDPRNYVVFRLKINFLSGYKETDGDRHGQLRFRFHERN